MVQSLGLCRINKIKAFVCSLKIHSKWNIFAMNTFQTIYLNEKKSPWSRVRASPPNPYWKFHFFTVQAKITHMNLNFILLSKIFIDQGKKCNFTFFAPRSHSSPVPEKALCGVVTLQHIPIPR